MLKIKFAFKLEKKLTKYSWNKIQIHIILSISTVKKRKISPLTHWIALITGV